ncbi:MYG1 exonuclease [Halotydeus destructor]|nr:MYG1 exonuclease [Halotydeus destructor]
MSSSEATLKNGPLVIATHNGAFHADDALACFLLKTLPEFKTAKIIRTREPNLINDADVVVDVGAVYDPESKRYDHHQKTFTETMDSLRPGKDRGAIKLSSAGLVYHHYGFKVLSNLLSLGDEAGDVDDKLINVIWDKVYENFVKEFDAIDNGVSICDSPKYEIHTHIASRVAHLKPNWNEPSNEDILLERFHQAMELVGREFTDKVRYYGRVWWPARKYVLQSLERRFEVDPSGDIMDLSKCDSTEMFPWKEHLFELEKELNIEKAIKFVLFPEDNGKWRVQTVPVTSHSFASRISLHKEWQGLRGAELSTKSGIEGCVFVHATGFIGGNDTRDGALEMARKTLKLNIAST